MVEQNDKSLREGLHVLLLHADPTEALESWLRGGRESAYQRVPDTFADKLVRNHPNRYSRDDGARMAEILQEGSMQDRGLGVFGLIFDFVAQTLIEREHGPLVRYEQVLRFRDTVHPLGTMPFLSAFLAGEDQYSGSDRWVFSFDPVPRSDNRRLRSILAEGMAENHFHLKGSAPAFHLSWICLMNDVTRRRKTFEKMSEPVLGESVRPLRRPLYVLVTQAALIRAFLFTRIKGSALFSLDTPRTLRRLLSMETAMECDWSVGEIQTAIAGLRAVCGSVVSEGFRPDYAVPGLAERGADHTFDCLAGEYWFQYQMFKAMLERRPEIMDVLDLFYAYLVTSIRFRRELVQSDRGFGFQNFSQYDHRKSGFLDLHPEFQRAQISMAAMTELNDPRIRAVEARIVPGENANGTARLIKRTDTIIAREAEPVGTGGMEPRTDRQRLGYILHIPKRRDGEIRGAGAYLHCRDARLRARVRNVVSAVIALREGCDSAAGRIRGMDACANEADARPEVFAPEYRRLKRHQPNDLPARRKQVSMMNLTYHVGEDFPDVVDGLRAVWEAVEFLELGRSDRIGHALALGIDVGGWFRKKQYRIFLTRQALLDNCAWMLGMLERGGEDDIALTRELRQVCDTQYAAVYQSTMPDEERRMSFNLTSYWRALELRGDEPEVYMAYHTLEEYHRGLEAWKVKRPFAMRRDQVGTPLYEARRHDLHAIWLYHHYHFNPETKQRGEEMVEYCVSKRYAQAAARLQTILRRSIAEKGVGIEANPSSNVLIGNFNRYDRHPLTVFNDLGLFDDPENAHLYVSINTDDQGIFDTSLENEYALVARGLEQMTDENGARLVSEDRIYGWLDHVRRMGLTQSFLNDQEEC